MFGNGQITSIVSGATTIFAGVYLVVVVWNGNASKLWDELKKELGFVEFLIAVLILAWFINNGTGSGATPLGQLLASVASLGILSALIVVAGKWNYAPLSDFANGNAGLFQTLFKLTGN